MKEVGADMNEWKMTAEEIDNAWQAGFPEYRDADVASAAQKKLLIWLHERCNTPVHVGYVVWLRVDCVDCMSEINMELGQ